MVNKEYKPSEEELHLLKIIRNVHFILIFGVMDQEKPMDVFAKMYMAIMEGVCENKPRGYYYKDMLPDAFFDYIMSGYTGDINLCYRELSI